MAMRRIIFFQNTIDKIGISIYDYYTRHEKFYFLMNYFHFYHEVFLKGSVIPNFKNEKSITGRCVPATIFCCLFIVFQ